MGIILRLLSRAVFGAFKPRSRYARNKYTRVYQAKKKFQPFDAKSATKQPFKPAVQGSAYIVDGDTLVIKKIQIRLFGIDAPEINHPYGIKAKWALVSLCKGQTVHVEFIEQDTYGRTVAKCFLPDGRDLSAEMVKLGLAIDWPKFSDGRYRSLEIAGVRKKLWLADARQNGRMHVWKQFEAKKARATKE
ncbi:MAG: thermonuclease family protein [Devosiaceae bacterium]|nr:thermonuclease family protein [Devosiaceae bacterium]